MVSKAKPDANDLRRSIGYTMITFLSVFIFFPVLWFVHLFNQDLGLYMRWGICSAFLVVFNILYYYWEYPQDWFKNLLALVGINLLILIAEYFWLIQSMG
ncbi:putative membrane protein [Candidatus Desulfosporosinus infrequens]|uniref:Putative membrane protein n=1 Tax=Candidatus Desulfosporosinus infrequens TaxID=2043169 RepID=A0A2U3KW71_9FIRM|nr:putative membrane protein [Candidatus Desulfosporosinus infrequens]